MEQIPDPSCKQTSVKKNLSKAIKPKKYNLNKSSGKNIPEL
jgi:hypothetical protein